MEAAVDVNAPLDYATIQIFPTQNRYEAFVCADDKIKKFAAGPLEVLLPYLPGISSLYALGSNANFKLQAAGEQNDTSWLTMSTLNRFLQIVGSPDLLNAIKVIEGEWSQLEETRKFHLSLYAGGHLDHFGIKETDCCTSKERALELKVEEKITSSDKSKNELLRALDLRLTALRMELSATLNEAAGGICSSKEISDLVEFCNHFGADGLKNSFCTILELMQQGEMVVCLNDKHPSTYTSEINNLNKTDGSITPISSVTPVKYGVSPAVVAQAERQSSTESEESSESSNENSICVERSRALLRSAAPRRSASPMRRIQIGRSGSRRAAALTVKSLGYYPVREKASAHKVIDTSSIEEERSEQHVNTLENNLERISVRDAIKIFESKQGDKSPGIQKGLSSSKIASCTSKSVLRRWSAGIEESTSPSKAELASNDSIPLPFDDLVDGEISKHLVEEKLDFGSELGCQNPVETTGVNFEFERREEGAHDPVNIESHNNATQEQENNGRLMASAESNRQKEVELNRMMMKMVESRAVRNKKPQTSKNQNIPSQQKGGFYDQYKEKRDEKLRGEKAAKRKDKEAQFREMQQSLDERKAEMASNNVKSIGEKHYLRKTQKLLNNPSLPAKHRNENPKAFASKNVSSKKSAMPATRKSWPSTPSTRATRLSPSKTLAGSSSAASMPIRRKSQSTPSVSQSNTKAETSQPHKKNVKKMQTNNDGNVKVVKEKMQQTVVKKGNVTNVKALHEQYSGAAPSKLGSYNKVTRKSSVVPLESKLFQHKGSGVGHCDVSVNENKTKHSSQLERSCIKGGKMTENEDNGILDNASTTVNEHDDQDIKSFGHSDAALMPKTQVNVYQNSDKTEELKDLAIDDDNGFKDGAESSEKNQSQEPMISPIAWVEIEEQHELPKSYDSGMYQVASPAHAAPCGLSSPRIRHSLSQMLQEDSSEPETVEWGNAENPPAMVYQKDAPKGLKRLLKFARKSKGDANMTDWSSPTIFSEGEDDAEDSKAIIWRKTDKQLRKAALRSHIHHEKNVDARKLLSAESHANTFSVHSSNKLHDSHISTTGSTTKVSKSFFSLSAFRGSAATK